MRFLVTGKHGQVVQALLQRGAETGVEVLTIGRPEMDMADPAQTLDAIRAAIKAHDPAIIINAAAYTAVDQAEDEPELAYAINALSAGSVAQAATEADLPIIQISTDYVFDGIKEGTYSEKDLPNPQNVYGASKLAGEEAVRVSNPRHLILRTAWVYSPFGKNFVKTMLRLAETKDELRIVADQFGNPSSAYDIASAIIHAAPRALAGGFNGWGTYHLSGKDNINWSGFARQIFDASQQRGGPNAAVINVTSADYPTKATRPRNSRLSNAKFEEVFAWKGPDWRKSMEVVVERILCPWPT